MIATSPQQAVDSFCNTSLGWQRHNLKIIDKHSNLIPLDHNIAQLRVWNTMRLQIKANLPIMIIIVKARQEGVSTEIEAKIFENINRHKNRYACVVSADEKSTTKVFRMCERFQEEMPLDIKRPTDRTNAREIRYSMPHRSGILCQTAGTKVLGRGGTTQDVHATEVAFWGNAKNQMLGLMQEVPETPDTMVVWESTANGDNGAFHDEYWKAVGRLRNDPHDYAGFLPVFLSWQSFPEYQTPLPEGGLRLNPDVQDYFRERIALGLSFSPEQMYFAALKIQNKCGGDIDLFKQEYPSCIVGTERVGTDKGIKRISDISFGKCSQGDIKKGWCSGNGEAVRIRTKLGYSVACTPDHYIAVGPEWVKAKDMIGKKVTLCTPLFSDKVKIITYRTLPCVENKIVIDKDMGRFLGYFVGDGSYSCNQLSIVCTGKDKDVISDVERLITKIVGNPNKRVVGTKKGGIEIRIGCAPFAPVLRKLGVLIHTTNGCNKRKVCVPDCIWESPKYIVQDFLMGLFESDGFAGYKYAKVSLFSQYLEFLRDIQLLLLGFGITCKITSLPAVNGQGYKYQSNTLTLRTKEAIKFAKEIGFVSDRKNNRAVWKESRNGTNALLLELVDEVVSIEPIGKHDVYDLNVPTKQQFDAGGILVHNSAREAFQSSGRMVFKTTALDLMERRCKKPIANIEFYMDGAEVKYRNVNRSANCWSIWRWPDKNHEYIEFGDVAEGIPSDSTDEKSDLDRSVAGILDRNRFDLPAVYYGRPDTIEYGDQMLMAAKYFNYAWASPEMNSIGQSVLDTFKRDGYQYIYQRENKEETVQREDTKLLGYKTTTATRKPMIADLQVVIKEGALVVYDIRVIDELRVFIWNSQGKPCAKRGEHDDSVIMVAGCIQLHQRCPVEESYGWVEKKKKPHLEGVTSYIGETDSDDDVDGDPNEAMYEDMGEYE